MLDNIDVYRTVLESLPVPVFIKDANHRFVFINRLACVYFGKPAEEIIGKSDYDFFPAEEADLFRAKDQLVFSTGQDNENEELITDQDGTTHTIVTRKSLLTVNHDKYLLVSINDITALRESETRARYLAHHDSLTGLPNRNTLYERLNHLLGRASPADSAVALLLVDLDGFKSVNDTYGHQAGDELLREYGRRLNAIVHEPDLVVRMGGDEFAVLVCAPAWKEQLDLLCMRIIESASTPFQVAGVHSFVRGSVGAFRIGAADISAGEVVRRADTALYEAKHRGKGCYCIYSPALDAGLIHRRTIENELTQALVNGTGLSCAYQPLIRGEDGSIIGVEALARWEHPGLGNVPPLQFVPVAEESGLITRLGEWVLRRACREAKQWAAIFLAVNVSAIQLRSGNFAASVLGILHEEGFPASRLELEITESAIVNADAVSIEQLKLLRAAGIRISLDDFGTGYSSLRLLRDLELDKVKIDQSFVQFVTQAKDSAAIVEALARLGTTLGLQVVAEGVETQEQRTFLMDAGCTSLQGILFSKPVTADSVSVLLERGHSGAAY